MSSIHGSHADVLKRLKRASGHLQKVIAMIEAGEECRSVAQQLHAVTKAIVGAKSTFIHDHIDHCLDNVVDGTGKLRRDEISEFKELAKYLDR